VEAKTSDSPVCLRITAFCTGKHNVEYKESEQNAKHSNKLQNGSSRNETVFFFLCRLNKRSGHNANAKEIADVGKVDVEIPTDRTNIVEDSQACNATYQA
jgi:hypothetical protein